MDKIAEENIANCVLYDNAVYDDSCLTTDDFQHYETKEIWRIISQLIQSGRQADKESLFCEINEKRANVSSVKIAELEPFTAVNWEYYAKIIKTESNRKKLKTMLKTGLEKLKQEEPEIVIAGVDKFLTEIVGDVKNKIYKAGEAMKGVIETIEEAHNSKRDILGLESGFPMLDEYLNGFQNGDVTVLAARTSIGKTALALNIVENMVLKKKYKVGFFSLEMTGKQIIIRLLSSNARVDHAKVIRGRMELKTDFERIHESAGRLYEANLWIDDSPAISLSQLRAKARQMKRMGIQIIFVDYISLIVPEDINIPRHERMAGVANSLKELARELEIPIIAISQLNREAEGKKPTLANIRLSGEIEECVSVILLMHRNRENEETELIIAKNRNGPTGTVNLTFRPQYTRFEERIYTGGRK